MLLDSVQRFDSKGQVKRVDIDALRQTHPGVYRQLKMVPAMMLLPSKEILYGKAVFDYLLLPARGKLVGGAPASSVSSGPPLPNATPNSNGILHIEEGIMAFNSAKGQFGECFADINETQSTPDQACINPHSVYQWTSIDEMMRQGDPSTPSQDHRAGPATGISSAQATLPGMNIETRTQKESLDLDAYRVQREKDLQSLFASQPTPGLA